MNSIFQIGDKYQTDEDVIEKIAMLFIEMLSISSYYDYIEEFFFANNEIFVWYFR